MQAHPDLEMFEHDNAHPHAALVCTAAVQTAGNLVMDWPAKSIDLSPIENLWAILGNLIRDIQNPPPTEAGLIASTPITLNARLCLNVRKHSCIGPGRHSRKFS